MASLWPTIDLQFDASLPTAVIDEGRDELERLTSGRLTLELRRTDGEEISYMCQIYARHIAYSYPLFIARWNPENPYPVTVVSDLYPTQASSVSAENPDALRDRLRKLFAAPRVVTIVKQLAALTA